MAICLAIPNLKSSVCYILAEADDENDVSRVSFRSSDDSLSDSEDEDDESISRRNPPRKFPIERQRHQARYPARQPWHADEDDVVRMEVKKIIKIPQDPLCVLHSFDCSQTYCAFFECEIRFKAGD